jgi:hypothetical protein
MAIISVGYDGAVTESQWSDMIKKIGSAEYGVVDATDWKVSSVTAADRTVSIAAGRGWGHGVYDESTATVQVQLDTVSSGSRWDMIAMRRDWTGIGGTSTFVAVQGSSAKEIPLGRQLGAGSIDEQPIALVRVVAGSTAVAEIIDLRCWAGNGGMAARDKLALTYLKAPGTQVMLDGFQWNCEMDPNGNAVWTTFRGGYIPVYGAGGTLAGGIPDLVQGGNFLVQAGTFVGVTDAAGYSRVHFQKPFPNGLLTVLTTNGDSSYDRMRSTSFNFPLQGTPGDIGRLGDFGYCMQFSDGRMVPNAVHRINWIAIGW